MRPPPRILQLKPNEQRVVLLLVALILAFAIWKHWDAFRPELQPKTPPPVPGDAADSR